MRKIIVLICIISMAIFLNGCAKKCFDCGKRASRGYTAFGNFYCEDCAWDIGI